ncbi:CPBP family intramembrane glutamic endopeptidase [Ligilactobacillus cholophilus]|uniref:CPBP family intramembrane glutamic endopeptidase n=1 Tax=Ligilactobacillus cholophilus TaxID=3050131 RepID=UPI0025B1C782|nr:type II CAAX endopeptidase family protein [Ligilactobacillus cholophilus]
MAIEKNSLSILLGYLFILISQLIIQKIFWSSSILYILLTIIGIIGALLLLFLNHKFSYQNLVEYQKKPKKSHFIIWGFIGIGIVLISQLIIGAIWHFTTHSTAISQNTNQLLTIFQSFPIYGLDIIIASPIIEELIFRKVFFGNLTYYFNPIISGIISSTLFAIAHHDGHFIAYFVMGCIFELIYYKAKDLRASMISHMGLNLFILLFFELKFI